MDNFNITKVKNDIADLKNKKQTLLMALQRDIDDITGKLKEEFCQVGQKAYELSAEGVDSFEDLRDNFTAIDACKAEYEAKNKKSVEIAARYDEEILLLEKLVPNESEAAADKTGDTPVSKPPQFFCMKCGKAYAPGVDIFCTGCGNKI